MKANLEEIERLTKQCEELSQENRAKSDLLSVAVEEKKQLASIVDILQQEKSSLEGSLQEHSSTVNCLEESITKYASELKEQTSLKEQALSDQEYMSEVYKDFESREAELSLKEHKLA